MYLGSKIHSHVLKLEFLLIFIGLDNRHSSRFTGSKVDREKLRANKKWYNERLQKCEDLNNVPEIGELRASSKSTCAAPMEDGCDGFALCHCYHQIPSNEVLSVNDRKRNQNNLSGLINDETFLVDYVFSGYLDLNSAEGNQNLNRF